MSTIIEKKKLETTYKAFVVRSSLNFFLGPKLEGDRMNWFSPNYFSDQNRDKDYYPHLETIVVKSFLTFLSPGRNSGPQSCTKAYTTFSALATPCPLCDLLWLKQ